MNNHVNHGWSEYNRNLVNRGSITFWISEKCLNSWVQKTGKNGRPSSSTAVIQASLIIETVYNLPLRALQSSLSSVDLKCPHYFLFCKRAKKATASLPKLSKSKPMEIAIDSFGLKISGESK